MTELEVSRRERKKEETKRRIFQEAVRLFRERGFEATTVDEIAERADVAKGTFFNHFPRKESILSYLSETRLEVAEASAEELLASKRPAREKLIETYLGAAAAYAEDRELTRHVLIELLLLRFTPTMEIGARWEQLLVSIFKQGQASGELRADVSAEQAVDILTSVYYALLFMWSSCPETLSLDAAATPEERARFECARDLDVGRELRARLTLVLDGLATRPGGGS
uniref:TetR/AcrR family transcriptional regulator n=1 Tax=Eiseniibacteriota bacterium TaxID=2212470 RepID=A0A832MIZ9_UNCEI